MLLQITKDQPLWSPNDNPGVPSDNSSSWYQKSYTVIFILLFPYLFIKYIQSMKMYKALRIIF